MMYVELVAGFVLLLVGGEALVRGAVAAARSLGVSPLMIGLTLVGFGTSTPELVTSLEAAFIGSPGIAIGNVVGSNIANILLILGLAAVIAPVACSPSTLRRDGSIVLVAAVACAVVCMVGYIGRLEGVLFVVAICAYVTWTYLQERASRDPSAELHRAETELVEPGPRNLGLALLLAGTGIGATILGAKWLVDGAVVLAGTLGVSDTVIGLTVVAVGTSLPELVTSVVAALRRHSAIALGNVLGSNIYNVFAILGITALVHPLEVPAAILDRDVWVMLAATLLLLGACWTGRRICRIEGGLFLLAYGVYMGVLFAVGV